MIGSNLCALQKHLAKGRDLHLAANKIAVLSESAQNLKTALDQFAEKLEKTRERIEGGARLLHLLTQHQRETSCLEELQRLAAQLNATALLDKHLPAVRRSSTLPAASSTPAQAQGSKRGSYRCSSGNGSSFEGATGGSQCSCWRESRNLEDMDEPEEEPDRECLGDADGEEQQSKIADSGVGVCDNCERNPKLARICSCQSLNEKRWVEATEAGEIKTDAGIPFPSQSRRAARGWVLRSADQALHGHALAHGGECSSAVPCVQPGADHTGRAQLFGTKNTKVSKLLCLHAGAYPNGKVCIRFWGALGIFFGSLWSFLSFYSLSQLESFCSY